MLSLKTAVGFQVLGEAYSTHDEEDMAVKEVTAISISQGRYVPISHRLFLFPFSGTFAFGVSAM